MLTLDFISAKIKTNPPTRKVQLLVTYMKIICYVTIFSGLPFILRVALTENDDCTTGVFSFFSIQLVLFRLGKICFGTADGFNPDINKFLTGDFNVINSRDYEYLDNK